jgi:hypothetical protein
MKKSGSIAKWSRLLVISLLFTMTAPLETNGQATDGQAFKQEELDQILAPIALYPDALLAQILMAATYPLEVVQADRWAQQNRSLGAEAMAAALEKEIWDPSVKSLVNFPDVLSMMSAKLDWTQKLGDAFLSQQKDVMGTVQTLRQKAAEAGNLNSTAEQKVIVQQETIVIESANPQVVYVPTYNSTVVYGPWPYPAYPPYYYYPPGYAAGAALFSFGVGVAVGAAWGYAWGGCNWHGGDVDIDVNRNTDINRNIDRSKHAEKYQGGQGKWQHNPEHRKGVSYRDQSTGQKFNRASTNEAVKSRENFRGRAEAGQQDLARGGADQFKGRAETSQRGGPTASQGRVNTGQRGGSGGARMEPKSAGTRESGASRGSAFSSMDRGGGETRSYSQRGSSSRQSMSSGGRSGGGRGGGRR